MNFLKLVIISLVSCVILAEDNEFLKNINFIVYDNEDQIHNFTYRSTDLDSVNCSIEEPLSFIIPGWRDDCNTSEWIINLVDNLQKHRGGCVVCMDFFFYSKSPDYFSLVAKYDDIWKVLFKEYMEFQNYGHEPENIFVFGFSYGANLALDLGRALHKLHNGTHLISRMDVCEPTGVGFLNMKDSKLAAENVQCIHTNSITYGTLKRDCHQDWNLGLCGNYQLAHGPYPKGSHGLCPDFYNSAFDNNFYAVPKEEVCLSRNEAKSWPIGFKMGYKETRFENVTGEFYAETTRTFPFNNDVSDNIIKMFKFQTRVQMEEFLKTVADQALVLPKAIGSRFKLYYLDLST